MTAVIKNFGVKSNLEIGGYITTVNGITPSNGQLMIGDSTNGRFSLAAITATNGASVTNGAGTIQISTNGTSANTASTLVLRDGSGNFTAGTITASLTGNASSATKLQTARTINGVSFDGTANISFTTDAVTEGSTNKYYTDVRAAAAAPVQTVAGRSGAVVLSTTDISGYGTVDDVTFTLTDQTDATKIAKFELSGLTTATTRTYTMPNVTGALATIGNLTQSFSGTTTFSAASVTVGSSTATSTYGLGTGATLSGSTKTVNIGTAGVAGSTTVINIGSSTSTTTVAVSGALSATSFSGPLTGAVTGNADTATKLATARTIAGVSFDGSANITLGVANITGAAPTDAPSFTNQVTSAGAIVGTSTIVIRGSSGEGGQLVLGYGGSAATSINGQANSSWNIDVDGSNAFRIFRQGSSGTIVNAITIDEATGSPALQNTPTTPTAATGTNTTQVASTAFVANTVNARILTVTSVSAAGSTQAAATVLSAGLNAVTSSTAGTATGVRLPSTAGMECSIVNDTANTITVYVATSSVLNGTTNGTVTIPAFGALDFVSTSTTKWFAKTAVYA